MSKAAAATLVVLGGGASVGGVFLHRYLSFDTNLPHTFDAFKETNGGGCVQDLFPGISKMDGTGTPDSNDLFVATTGKAKGCLVVNWDKQKNETDSTKWRGNFRFLWAMSQGNRGFVVFSAADTTADKKLKGIGAAYALKEENKAWSIDKKKDLSSKEIDQSSSSTKFPKAAASFDGMANNSDFWGFMSANTDMNNIEGSIEDWGKTMSEYFRGYWVWESDDKSSTTADAWSSQFEAGGNETHQKTPGDLKSKLANVKGKGTNKSISPLQKAK